MFEDEGHLSHLRFPQKLWYLLNSRTDTIIWGTFGRSILLNYNLLDTYLRCNASIFKTIHISSFIRQLNLYGFRKVTSHLQDPLCNASNPGLHEYMHDYFQFGKVELLSRIKRKTWNMKKYADTPRLSHPSLKIRRTFGSRSLRKARKNLQDALLTATQQYDRVVVGVQGSNMTEDKIEYSRDPRSNILPITWSTKASKDLSFYSDEYIPYSFVPSASSQISIPASQEYNEGMNLSSYIENFRANMNTSSMEESYVGPQDEYSEYEYMPTSEEQVQPIDYKSFLNNSMVVVEVLDHENPEYITPEQGSPQWNNKYQERESYFEQSDDLVKMEENPLPDHEFENPCDKSKDETFTDTFGAPWEYKEILKEMVTKKDFPDQEYGSELKELYSQISKSIDILNS